MNKIILLGIILLGNISLQAQNSLLFPSLLIKEAKGEIILDGNLDELSWFEGLPADDFWQYFPLDSTKAQQKTEIYMTYDNDFLYVGVKCHAISDKYITPSLRRDFSAFGNDNITLLFDTYNDRTNAFVFGINPYGVCREALVSNAGMNTEDFGTSWDNKWMGKAKIYDKYWVAEFAIPFKTLRFKGGVSKWRFNSYRFDTQLNEISTWARIPQNQSITNLAYMGNMIWDKPLNEPKNNFSIIPYIKGGRTKDFTSSETTPNYTYDAGLDAKIGITSGLNLDLTINPDFSQVEVDQQVTDLSRFEIFFPERRQFFLENADLFSEFGNNRIKPFFSRRIGIATDPSGVRNNVENPIRYGAKLSGKLNNDWRVGLINMQTAANENFDLPSFNYTAAAVQRKLAYGSNIGALLVNRSAFGQDSSAFDRYNRVSGLEYNLASFDNRWTGEFFYHHAITPEKDVQFKGAHGAHLNYQVKKYRLEWTHHLVGDGFDAQTGFVQRKNLLRLSPEVELFFYPKESKWLNRHSINFDYTVLFQPEWGLTDQSITIDWKANLKDNSSLKVTLANEYVVLTSDDFDPSGLDSIPLVSGSHYDYNELEITYRSDQRKSIFLTMSAVGGQYYNGYRYGVNGNLNFLFRPYGSIGLNYSYNYIELPNIQSSLVLLGPKIDITFTKNIFVTAFFQYNNQSNNFNVNARLQWRFKPVSDFFLVYTKNYYASDFGNKNSAIVAKFTYWLNL